MAKIIEFYIPANFRKRVQWVTPQQRGKIIEFLRHGKEDGLAQPTAISAEVDDCGSAKIIQSR